MKELSSNSEAGIKVYQKWSLSLMVKGRGDRCADLKIVFASSEGRLDYIEFVAYELAWILMNRVRDRLNVEQRRGDYCSLRYLQLH